MGSCIGKVKEPVSDGPPKCQSSTSDRRATDDKCNAQSGNDINKMNYKLNGDRRGLVLLFNHENFDEETKQVQRYGTDKDVEKIRSTFDKLGFEVHPYKDLTLSELRDRINDYVSQDHRKRDCLVIFILTHGGKDMGWAKDASYSPATEIWEKFTNDKCPSLAGKPKLIFLQTCQGEGLSRGARLQEPTSCTGFDSGTIYDSHADFLTMYAASEGFVAFCNSEDGSYFITVLCQELENQHKHTDLLNILTVVNRRVATEFCSNSTNPSKNHCKQMPYFKSSLTRKLIFGHG